MLLKIHRKGAPDNEFEVVNVTKTEFCILSVLGELKTYAYGIYKLSNGSIKLNGLYTMLNRMKNKKLVDIGKGCVCENCGHTSEVVYSRTFDFMEEYKGEPLTTLKPT